jgi:hypothetical protein
MKRKESAWNAFLPSITAMNPWPKKSCIAFSGDKLDLKTPDILEITLRVVKAFDSLGIEYYIGGSIASSAYGVARSTLDVDMVAILNSEQAHSLEELLKEEFYIDIDTIDKAVAHHSSFNLVHLETMLKIDVFIHKDQPYANQVFIRRKDREVSEDFPEKFCFPSPEDIILIKLDWYKSAGESLSQQWNDVLGVLKVQGSKLDLDYMKKWAEELHVSRLLRKSFEEAGITRR